jgi:hypothetical protein
LPKAFVVSVRLGFNFSLFFIILKQRIEKERKLEAYATELQNSKTMIDSIANEFLAENRKGINVTY